MPSGPGKPDPLGDRAPVPVVSSSGIRYEYRMSFANISGGDGTYWTLGPSTLQPKQAPVWVKGYSKPVAKDLYWAELPMSNPSGFVRLGLSTRGNKTRPSYWP